MAFRVDVGPGVPCAPGERLRLVVEGSNDEEIPLPADIPVGTVFELGVTPFWVGFNRGCIQDRPNDLILDGVGLSRNSCCFVMRDGRWYGYDHSGTTPLRINGGDRARWEEIHEGDVVDIGRVRCRALAR